MRYLKRGTEDAGAAAAMERMGCPALLARILSMRGVKDEREAEAFLSPSLAQLHDPFEMKGMREAAEGIRAAVSAGKRIVIFGDYDADGVTATAALLSQLRDMGAVAGYYLPSRHGEGYGLSDTAVRSLAGSYDMMITVDCGITALAEVATARSVGLDVIVTDHHEPLPELPDCICVNPKLGYPFRDLCGAGVAGKLVQALGGVEALGKVIDLVALGTIADIVPLLDENRVLAYEGLKAINEGTRPGIAALIEVSGFLGKSLSSGHVSFSIAPRVNAGGRIGHSGKSVEMLLTRDRAQALETAKELDELNRERQRQEQEILQAAIEQAEAEDLRSVRALVLEGEGWNPGVIGVVASRVVEKYSRPTFILSRDGELCVGSGRSVPGVHLFDALQSMGEMFTRFGGHEMAAGLTIRSERSGEFRRALQAYMEDKEPALFLPTAMYDVEAAIENIEIPLVRAMERLAPTGQGNPAPVFLLRGVAASGARAIGADGAHLRFTLAGNGASLQTTAFKMGARADVARGLVDALVIPEIDTYSGVEQVRLVARSFEKARDAFAAEVSARGDELTRLHLQSIDCAAQGSGFRQHIRLKGMEHVRSIVLSMLNQSVGGVLIACALPETALMMDAWLKETPCDAMVTRCAGNPPGEASAPHMLCCPATPEGAAHYSQIVLPDGVWQPAWVERLLKVSPGAAVYAPQISDQALGAVRAAVPDIDEARRLYRVLKAQAPRVRTAKDFYALGGMLSQAGLSEPKMAVALGMLRDMGLIHYQARPFSISVVEDVQGKRDAEATPTYLFYQSFLAQKP